MIGYIDLQLRSGETAHISEKQLARFRSHVAEPNDEGCSLWTGPVDRNGYGNFRISDALWKPQGRPSTRRLLAHRVAFRLAYGRSPRPEMDVDHTDFNRLCLSHLQELTPEENGALHGGSNPSPILKPAYIPRPDLDTHCPQGHERSVYARFEKRSRARYCLVCVREKVARHNARKAIGSRIPA